MIGYSSNPPSVGTELLQDGLRRRAHCRAGLGTSCSYNRGLPASRSEGFTHEAVVPGTALWKGVGGN